MLAGLALALLARPLNYVRFQLFELMLCADVVVSGEIDSVGWKSFEVAVGRVIAGEAVPPTLRVKRFENWTCASRWTGYRAGQHVLLFLHRQGPDSYTILGAGGEGEMPVVDSDVLLRGYRVRGLACGPHPVGDAQVEGALVPAEELASTTRAFRRVMNCAHYGSDQVSEVAPRSSMDEAQRFAQASRMAMEVFEEARSSSAWRGPLELEGAPIPVETLEEIHASVPLGGAERRPARRFPSGFGRSVALLGDVDGDGVGDLAVGAPSDGRLGNNHGTVWILFLDSEGCVRSRTEVLRRASALPAGMKECTAFGIALAPLGDLDRDGVPDVAVGARTGNEGSGATWILFLARDGTALAATEVGASDALRKAGTGKGYGLGAALASIGDLDGDGVPELAVGQEPAFELEQRSGRQILILSLDRAGAVRWVSAIHARGGGFAARESGFGDALAGIGDLDGNGVPDLAVADPGDSDGGEFRGAVWIVFLGNRGTLVGRQKISDWEGGFDAVLRDRERFGQALAGPGDVDGDGHVDLLVGSSSGIWTLLLNGDGTVRDRRLMRNRAQDPGGHFAYAVSAASSTSRPPRAAIGGATGDEASLDDVVWLLSLGRDGSPAAW